jgi:tripartite-type tricarboxylate transporter receptor subunit TctC
MGRTIHTLPLVAALIAGLAVSSGSAVAQTAPWPTKLIKLIIPFGPGGGIDAVAAAFQGRLSEKLGQSIIRDYRPGSNSVIGTSALANSPPDGYTMLITTGGIANNPFLYASLPYKTPESFTPVSILTSYPFVMAIRSGLPFNSVKELVEYAKAHPGELTAGTPGRGAGAELALGLFNKMAGVEIRKIPYKGAGGALTNVAAGFIDICFSGYETVRPFADGKHMKMLAHTGTDPLGAEQIPPIARDVPGYEYQNWLALIAPAGTPKAITDKVNIALKEIFAEQEVKNRLASQNISGIASTSDEAKAFLIKEMATSKSIIESIGLKPE